MAVVRRVGIRIKTFIFALSKGTLIRRLKGEGRSFISVGKGYECWRLFN